MADYHTQYMTPERKIKKAAAQKLRRQISEKRKKIDKEYNYKYVRTETFKKLRNLKRIERRKTDITYRLSERIRGRIKDLLGRDRPEAISKVLGCTALELTIHLEKQFSPGMSWDNYGFYGWHIDHILPLSSFNLKDIEQYRKACHHTNLQPMWAVDNLRKGAKVSNEQGEDDAE